MKTFTENTLVPIGLAVFVIGSGAGWITKMWIQTEAHGKSLDRLEQKSEAYVQSVDVINGRLSEIRERIVSIETLLKRGPKWQENTEQSK